MLPDINDNEKQRPHNISNEGYWIAQANCVGIRVLVKFNPQIQILDPEERLEIPFPIGPRLYQSGEFLGMTVNLKCRYRPRLKIETFETLLLKHYGHRVKRTLPPKEQKGRTPTIYYFLNRSTGLFADQIFLGLWSHSDAYILDISGKTQNKTRSSQKAHNSEAVTELFSP